MQKDKTNKDFQDTATLNRLQAPEFFSVKPFDLMDPQSEQYSNGMKAFYFHAGEQDVVRIEWIFENVYGSDEDSLIPSCVPSMLLEGTKSHSHAEIVEFIDFHGAYLVPEYNSDYSTLTLFSLNKHLPKLLPLVKEILTEATFPEKELNTYLRNRTQRLEISLEKNDVLARRAFNRILFGETRYGKSPEPDDFAAVQSEQLMAYYQNYYKPEYCTLVVAGNVSSFVQEQLQELFGESWTSFSSARHPDSPQSAQHTLTFPETCGKVHLITRPDALQSALRLGFRTVQRSHSDFPGLQFLNTVLGGYFGSRLMANIREDKGYSYGIGSGIVSLKEGAYLTIATEVGVDVTQAALDEIAKEIQALKAEPLGNEEMELVRNYLMGSLLGSLENVFSHADHFKQVYFSGLDLDYYDHYQQVVLTIDVATIQRLANEYLDVDAMEKIVVGKL